MRVWPTRTTSPWRSNWLLISCPFTRGAVGRAEVVGGREVAVELDVDVPARDALVQQLQIGLRAASDDVAARSQVEAPVGLIDDEHRAGLRTRRRGAVIAGLARSPLAAARLLRVTRLLPVIGAVERRRPVVRGCRGRGRRRTLRGGLVARRGLRSSAYWWPCRRSPCRARRAATASRAGAAAARRLRFHPGRDSEDAGVQLVVAGEVDLDVADGLPPVLVQVLLQELGEGVRQLDLPRHQTVRDPRVTASPGTGWGTAPARRRSGWRPSRCACRPPRAAGHRADLDRLDLALEDPGERSADEALEAAFEPLGQSSPRTVSPLHLWADSCSWRVGQDARSAEV